MNLQKLVQDKIASFATPTEAAAYFEVKTSAISAWKNGGVVPTLKAAQKVLDEAPEAAAPAPVVMPKLEIAAPPVDDNPYGVGPKESVVILSPSYDGMEQKMVVTLFKAIKEYGIDKVSIIPGNERTLIDEERNDLVAKYRRIPNKPEWVIMVDADHVLPCGNAAMLKKLGVDYPAAKMARNALTRIMSHPKECLIVGGLYKNRRAPYRPACEIAYRSPQEEARMRSLFDPTSKVAQSDKLEESGWVGAGWLKIHHSVFDRMEEASKNGGPLAEIAPPAGRESDPVGFFGRNSKFRGEDVFFCRRAAEVGVKCYVDTGILIGHIFKGVV